MLNTASAAQPPSHCNINHDFISPPKHDLFVLCHTFPAVSPPVARRQTQYTILAKLTRPCPRPHRGSAPHRLWPFACQGVILRLAPAARGKATPLPRPPRYHHCLSFHVIQSFLVPRSSPHLAVPSP